VRSFWRDSKPPGSPRRQPLQDAEGRRRQGWSVTFRRWRSVGLPPGKARSGWRAGSGPRRPAGDARASSARCRITVGRHDMVAPKRDECPQPCKRTKPRAVTAWRRGSRQARIVRGANTQKPRRRPWPAERGRGWGEPLMGLTEALSRAAWRGRFTAGIHRSCGASTLGSDWVRRTRPSPTGALTGAGASSGRAIRRRGCMCCGSRMTTPRNTVGDAGPPTERPRTGSRPQVRFTGTDLTTAIPGRLPDDEATARHRSGRRRSPWQDSWSCPRQGASAGRRLGGRSPDENDRGGSSPKGMWGWDRKRQGSGR